MSDSQRTLSNLYWNDSHRGNTILPAWEQGIPTMGIIGKPQVLRAEESELIEVISEKIDDAMTYGIVDIIIDVVPELGRQTLISVAGYKSDNPISYDIEQL